MNLIKPFSISSILDDYRNKRWISFVIKLIVVLLFLALLVQMVFLDGFDKNENEIGSSGDCAISTIGQLGGSNTSNCIIQQKASLKYGLRSHNEQFTSASFELYITNDHSYTKDDNILDEVAYNDAMKCTFTYVPEGYKISVGAQEQFTTVYKAQCDIIRDTKDDGSLFFIKR